MNIIASAVTKRKREDQAYGYNLFVAFQPVTFCTNDDQRKGWFAARRGALAAATVEAVFSAGGSASDADMALQGAW